jgi:hypothetical protein
MSLAVIVPPNDPPGREDTGERLDQRLTLTAVVTT